MVDSDLSLPCCEGHEVSQSRPRDYFCSFEKSVFCFWIYFNFSFWQNVCFVYLLFNFRENVQKARVILNESVVNNYHCSRQSSINSLIPSFPLPLLFVCGWVCACACMRVQVCVCVSVFSTIYACAKSILSWRFLGIKSTHFCPSGI